MKSKSCPVCGTPMKKNGFTSSGKQRWRCRGCGMSRAHSKDNTSIRLKEFLSWLFSKDTQSSMPGSGRTFRRRTKEFWDIWPMPEVVVTDSGSGFASAVKHLWPQTRIQ